MSPRPSAVLVVRLARGQRVVADACGNAWRAGVRPGLSLAHARGVVSGARPSQGSVHVVDEDAGADRASLMALARWMQRRWSPRVEIDGADGFMLDITGCAHLFGGERPLARSLVERVRAMGFTARGAIASTVGAAWALARYGPSAWTIVEPGQERAALETLNVASLRLDASGVEALSQIGVDTVGQLLALPRRALPSRYGGDLLRRLDQALGTVSEEVDRTQECEPIEVASEISGGTTRLEDLHQLVRELLDEIEDRLAQHEAGLREIELRFARLGERKEDDKIERVVVRVSRATRDAAHVYALARAKLDRVQMGFGVERVEARAEGVVRLAHRQMLAGGAQENAWQHDASFAALGDTLAERLGRECVLLARVRQRHRPEHAGVLAPLEADRSREDVACDRAAAWAARTLGPRPPRLFTPAQEVQTIALTPDGPVMRLRWQGRDRAIVACIGPERIGPEWWLSREPTRDYFRVQDELGRWLWVYRELDASNPDARWFIHGEWS